MPGSREGAAELDIFAFTLEEELTMAGRLLLAVAVGSIIGYERERRPGRVGIRTVAVVTAGACVFTLASIFGFAQIGDINDPARIAAQVVVGVGFIGAGVMFREGSAVRGLTTAATIWFAAAVGMAAAAGMYVLTVLATILVFLILRYFPQQDR